jgi:hypothetical protein
VWGEQGCSLRILSRQAWEPPCLALESHHPELPVMPVVPSVLVMGAKLATLANVDTYPMRVASITAHS